MRRSSVVLRGVMPYAASTVVFGVCAVQPVSAQPQAATVQAVVRTLATGTTDRHDAPLVQSVVRFYAERAFAPAWTDAQGLSRAGRQLCARIADADRDGLDPRSYPLPPLDSVAHTAEGARMLAQRDVQLTYVVLRYAQDLAVGLTVPGAVHRDDAYERPHFNGDSLLQALATASGDNTDDLGEALGTLAPRSAGYRSLRHALQQLRAVEQRGGWQRMPPGPALRRGDAGARVAWLRRLLHDRGDLADSTTSDAFDAPLAAALARFQARHGLPDDSVAGVRTIAALNVPVADRLEQVRLGMERARWLAPVAGDRWITVNLADYRAFVFDDGVPVFETRVVIGATNHKTPMFVDTLTNIVLNPAWNVPPSIVAKEIRPKLQRDPQYLTRNHMVRVNGGIQQLPGPWNALGQIAFMFPNAFNVYMHDTPAKELFAAPDRAHSHGCIRVQRPHELAALLLAGEGWTPPRLDSAIVAGQRYVIRLRQPVPVRITYVTAFSSADGSLQFRPDVYGRDALLRRAMDRERRRPLPALFR